MLILDSHCDTIERCFVEGLNFTDKKLSFKLLEVKKNLLPYIQVMASYIDPEFVTTIGGYNRANQILDEFYRQLNIYKDSIYLIKEKEDFDKILDINKLGVMLSIENGSAVDKKIENVDKLYNRGIRMMSVTYSVDNEFGCGCNTLNDLGLTDLGKEYIKKLLNKNIAIDVSHISEKSFFDIMKMTDKPIIASHSDVKALCNHPRNLSDEQIRQIAKHKGYIGICYCNTFLDKNNNSSVIDIVNNIDYIANLVGIDYIGLGSDFDGLDGILKMKDISSVKNINIIFEKLQQKGYSNNDIEKIAGKNAKKVLKEII